MTTIAGDGTTALSPWGMTIDSEDNVYFTDFGNYTVHKYTSSGSLSTIAGSGSIGLVDGEAMTAQFGDLKGITMNTDGDLLVGDGSRIRKIASGVVSTIAGDGTPGYVDGDASVAKFSGIYGVAVNSKGEIFVTERNNFAIRKIVFE